MTNTLNPDKLIKYTSESDPEKSILIPLKHAYKARKIQSLAIESENMDEFYNHMSLWPSLKDVYIPDKTVSFVHGEKTDLKKAFKLYDEVYLETCLHLITDELSTMDGDLNNGHEYRARERYNAIRNHQNIKNFLGSL